MYISSHKYDSQSTRSKGNTYALTNYHAPYIHLTTEIYSRYIYTTIKHDICMFETQNHTQKLENLTCLIFKTTMNTKYRVKNRRENTNRDFNLFLKFSNLVNRVETLIILNPAFYRVKNRRERRPTVISMGTRVSIRC